MIHANHFFSGLYMDGAHGTTWTENAAWRFIQDNAFGDSYWSDAAYLMLTKKYMSGNSAYHWTKFLKNEVIIEGSKY